MTSDGTLMQEIIDRQRENERYFALAVMGGGGASALQECTWLEPEIFVDKAIAKFWEGVRIHGDTLRATNDAQLDMIGLERALPGYDLLGANRVDEYARVISECYYFRTVLEKTLDMVRAVRDADVDKVQQISENIHSITPCAKVEAYTAAQISAEFIPELNKVHVGAVITMIPEFDNSMGGFFPNELTVLAGRPGMGKTAFALQIARNVAVSGKKVLFLSLEMSRMQLWARMACGDAGYSWRDVRAGSVDTAGLANIARISNELQKLFGDRLLVQDEVWTLQEIQQSVSLHKPDLVIIDHLGEITRHPENIGDIEWYPRAVKFVRRYITRRMRVPTILIHQLNRGVEGRDDKRPMLSDLRASGEIEQLADIVLMCYRDDYYNDSMSHLTRIPFELLVRKNRQGAMNGTIDLVYDLSRQWFNGTAPSPMAP